MVPLAQKGPVRPVAHIGGLPPLWLQTSQEGSAAALGRVPVTISGPRPFSAVCALGPCAPWRMAAPPLRFAPLRASGAAGPLAVVGGVLAAPAPVGRRAPLRHPPACRKSPCGGTGAASVVLTFGPPRPRPLRSAPSLREWPCSACRGPGGPHTQFSGKRT